MDEKVIQAAIMALTVPLSGSPNGWTRGAGASWPAVNAGECIVSTWDSEIRFSAAISPSTGAASAVLTLPRRRKPRVVDVDPGDFEKQVRQQVEAFVRANLVGEIIPLGLWISERMGPLQVVVDVNRVYTLTDGRPEDRAIMFAFLSEQESIYFVDGKGCDKNWQIPPDPYQTMPLDQVIRDSIALNAQQ
ncbi:hypothetical protein [Paractinoplanes atraurantiacus]|nr:hypothetical protein [Actinoplanes atraurantiacus]